MGIRENHGNKNSFLSDSNQNEMCIGEGYETEKCHNS